MKLKISLFFLITISFFLSSCGAGQLLGPTITPTPTSTNTPTSTPTNTPILTSTSVSAITQTEIPLFDSATETNSAPTFTPVLPAGSKLLIYVIDVGQGDSILIQTPEGKIILIDGGEASSGVIPYLEHLGITNIDVIVATHPHSDHIGGLVEVLGAIPVSKVITNGEPHTTLTYERFLDAIATAKAEYVEVKRGDVISVGSINFQALLPVAVTNPDMNENSVVLRVTFGKTTILLMGDAGADTERDLIASGLPLKADILKVGHHGSKSASTPEFLSIVNPDVAIYSAGINNTYGHPAPETLAALSAVGATIYGTDQNGTVVVTIDENDYTINTLKNEVVSPPVLVATLESQPQPSNELKIVSVTSPVSAGGVATLKAKTSPGATCSITVYYKSGPSKAQGLTPITANASGEVTWSWKVGARTTPGTWPIDVSCGGITQNTSFEVR